MKKAVNVLLCCLIPAIYGCGHPELTRRYESARSCRADDGIEYVKVSAFTLDSPAPRTQPALLTLSPQGQAAFVQAVEKKSGSLADFLETLGAGVGTKPDKNNVIDRTKFHKRLVFTVEKSLPHTDRRDPKHIEIGPADRISELRVTLKDPDGARFVSWDRFNTEHETVDLGRVALAKGTATELGLGMGPAAGAGMPATVKSSVAFTRNLTEEVSLRQRYTELSGRLSPNRADLYQQGVVGIDLTGNFTVDFVIQVDPGRASQRVVSFGPLEKDGNPIGPNGVRIEFSDLKFPGESEAVTCKLAYAYRLRHVERNARTIAEGDDNVLFVTGENTKSAEVELISGSELKTRVFEIITRKRTKEAADETPGTRTSRYETSAEGWSLHIEGVVKLPICFCSYYSAKGFLEWIKQTQNTTVAGYRLTWGDRDLHRDDIPSMLVKGRDLN